ncbi:hypothetical protein PISMIDRAFT_673851 [Pisolithus microcarpus 441]|uniref:Uncharacterized protein n=1 Tax=Pisolithus microcarpus 441 TaxID=765257 RepID=A0A0D0A7Y3_9AGAM|nr:hypothetical protein PISMIDRAFT_673851 [Pisolithus microcarpus 441]
MADTEGEHERTTDEKKSNDKQLPVTDPKTDTDTDKKAPDGDGERHIPDAYLVNDKDMN